MADVEKFINIHFDWMRHFIDRRFQSIIRIHFGLNWIPLEFGTFATGVLFRIVVPVVTKDAYAIFSFYDRMLSQLRRIFLAILRLVTFSYPHFGFSIDIGS